MGIGVGRPAGIAGGGLDIGPGEATAVLIAERVAAGDVEHFVAPARPVEPAGEADPPVGRVGLVGSGPHGEDHLDDRVERPVGQDLESGGRRRCPGRAGTGGLGGREGRHTMKFSTVGCRTCHQPW